MSGERDIVEMLREYEETRQAWRIATGKDREETLELATRLVGLADEVADSIRGDALSIRGGSLLLTDDLESAEKCLLKAVIRQKEGPGKGATLRRMALLRALQGLYQDAESLAMKAAEIARSLQLEEGDAILVLGEIRYIRGMYDDAATSFLEAMQHLDDESPGFRIAAHNFMCSLVKSGKPEAVAALLPTLKSYVSQSKKTWTKRRAEWMLAAAYVRIGKTRRAARILSVVSAYLKEQGSAPEIANCYIDLAEAYYREGDMESATAALRHARDTWTYIHGAGSEPVRNLQTAVRTRCEALAPWEIRGHMPLQS